MKFNQNFNAPWSSAFWEPKCWLGGFSSPFPLRAYSSSCTGIKVLYPDVAYSYQASLYHHNSAHARACTISFYVLPTKVVRTLHNLLVDRVKGCCRKSLLLCIKNIICCLSCFMLGCRVIVPTSYFSHVNRGKSGVVS